jgi:hypothetical protein
MHEGNSHLSRLVDKAPAGERATPLSSASQCQVPDDFDQRGATQIADLFEGA